MFGTSFNIIRTQTIYMIRNRQNGIKNNIQSAFELDIQRLYHIAAIYCPKNFRITFTLKFATQKIAWQIMKDLRYLVRYYLQKPENYTEKKIFALAKTRKNSYKTIM